MEPEDVEDPGVAHEDDGVSTPLLEIGGSISAVTVNSEEQTAEAMDWALEAESGRDQL